MNKKQSSKMVLTFLYLDFFLNNLKFVIKLFTLFTQESTFYYCFINYMIYKILFMN